MVNRNIFRVSLFSSAFIAAPLLVTSQSHAAMQTFEKEYTYTASELDSKSSCRAIALEKDMKTAVRLGSPTSQDFFKLQGIPW